jgi:aspartyl-tRNA(Asn)/glutamyl-tRNA(Gln) amidotransferase subunit C
MKVTEKDVAYVAELANLDLSNDERMRMLRDLNSILDHIESLNELDTTDVPPMAYLSVASGEPGSAMREDAVEGLRKSLDREAALANAQEATETYFRVPKVNEH